jgi:hypothetical protein
MGDMVARAAALAIAALIAVACTSPSSTGASASPGVSPASIGASASPSYSNSSYLGSLGKPGCQPAAAFHGLGGGGGMPEAGFDSSKGSFWALFFMPVPPPAGKEIKVVWRMTGAGDFVFRVSDADGRTIPLIWGPDGHGSSSWNHPGSEVGTGFNFPHPGCWDVHVAKPTVDADLWLNVAA